MLICALLAVISMISSVKKYISPKLSDYWKNIYKFTKKFVVTILWTKKYQFGEFQCLSIFFNQKEPIWLIFWQKKHHLVIFSAKNRQFNTFLKTRTRTRLTGFLKIKTRNPLFQNPTQFWIHYIQKLSKMIMD